MGKGKAGGMPIGQRPVYMNGQLVRGVAAEADASTSTTSSSSPVAASTCLGHRPRRQRTSPRAGAPLGTPRRRPRRLVGADCVGRRRRGRHGPAVASREAPTPDVTQRWGRSEPAAETVPRVLDDHVEPLVDQFAVAALSVRVATVVVTGAAMLKGRIVLHTEGRTSGATLARPGELLQSSPPADHVDCGQDERGCGYQPFPPAGPLSHSRRRSPVSSNLRHVLTSSLPQWGLSRGIEPTVAGEDVYDAPTLVGPMLGVYGRGMTRSEKFGVSPLLTAVVEEIGLIPPALRVRSSRFTPLAGQGFRTRAGPSVNACRDSSTVVTPIMRMSRLMRICSVPSCWRSGTAQDQTPCSRHHRACRGLPDRGRARRMRARHPDRDGGL